MANYLSAYPALSVNTPDIQPAIQNFRTGMSDAQAIQDRNLLQQAGQIAATQGYLPASKALMAGGNINAGIKLADLDSETKTKVLGWVSRASKAADTPEKWNDLNDTLSGVFGEESVAPYRDFSKRSAALALVEQEQMRLAQVGVEGVPGATQTVGIQGNTMTNIGPPKLPVPPSTVQTVTVGGKAPGSTQLMRADENGNFTIPVGPEKLPTPSTAAPSPYIVDPNDPSKTTFRPGGPADPKVIAEKAGATTKGNIEALQGSDQVTDIAEGIKSGDSPPVTTGLYRVGAAVRAKLAKDGFDLSKAQLQWEAAKRQVQTLNSQRMVQYTSLAGSVTSTIDEVNNLAIQLKNSGIVAFNRAKLEVLTKTAGNTQAGQLASRYIAAVNTLKEEFANLANGGYAPTDAAWTLANQQVNGNYGSEQLSATLTEIKRLVNYRTNAIAGLGALGPSAPNQYTGQTGKAPDGTTILQPNNPPAVNPNSTDIRGTSTNGIPYTINP